MLRRVGDGDDDGEGFACVWVWLGELDRGGLVWLGGQRMALHGCVFGDSCLQKGGFTYLDRESCATTHP